MVWIFYHPPRASSSIFLSLLEMSSLVILFFFLNHCYVTNVIDVIRKTFVPDSSLSHTNDFSLWGVYDYEHVIFCYDGRITICSVGVRERGRDRLKWSKGFDVTLACEYTKVKLVLFTHFIESDRETDLGNSKVLIIQISIIMSFCYYGWTKIKSDHHFIRFGSVLCHKKIGICI